MRVARTLIIRRRLGLNEEEVERVLRRLDALGNLFARGYDVEPPDLPKRFIDKFRYFRSAIRYGEGRPLPKAWLTAVHAVGNVQIRLDNERDWGAAVFADLPKGVLRIRGLLPRRAVEVRLKPSELEHIKRRIEEGGRAKLARIWARRGVLHVAIVFEREAEPLEPSDYALVVDINSWRHGVRWWLVRGGRVASRGVERPDLGYIERLYEEALRVERRLGRLKRLGLDEAPEGKRLRRSIRRRLHAYLKNFAEEAAHRLVVKALKKQAKIVVDGVAEESRRELLEEGLGDGLTKLYMAYLPRFVDLLLGQAGWYGIPAELRRLPSTLCPVCGGRLMHVGGRTMACPRCGFRADRDEVPIMWYLKMGTPLYARHKA